MLTPTYVVIAGPIGAGKTSAARVVASELKNSLLILETSTNYLDRHYSDPSKWAFHNQLEFTIHFLESAWRAASAQSKTVIQDRYVSEAHEVFTKHAYVKGWITDEEFATLERMVRLCHAIRTPDILIMLDVEPNEAASRIARRGVRSELDSLNSSVLADLRSRYITWYRSYSLSRKELLNTTGLTEVAVTERIVAVVESLFDPTHPEHHQS